MLQDSLNNTATIRMRRQVINLIREGRDDKLQKLEMHFQITCNQTGTNL